MYKLNPRAFLSTRLKMNTRSGLLSVGVCLLLSACGGDVSDELAMDQPFDISLEQCELAKVGVVGEPTDPITVNGEETQACVLNTEFPEGVQSLSLKTSHRYEPLAWVLDGTYHIGESKAYSTLTELEEDPLVSVSGLFYARENTLVIIHRNGRLTTDIKSIDDDLVGGGEWGGVVVNGAGFHPDCPADTSANKLCNIEGPWGYFGGLSLAESREYEGNYTSTLPGMAGSVAEAGGEVAGEAQPGAALVVNAPLSKGTAAGGSVFYSSGNGLEVNGGDAAISLNAMGNQGHAAVWRQGFSGSIEGIIYHGNSDVAALRGEAGDQPVVLRRMTLVDKDLTAGTALQLTGTHQMDNLVIQGFAACLQFDGSSGASALQNSVFYCDQTAVPGPAGGDHAAQVVAAASNFHEEDPDLTPALALGNPEIALDSPGAESGNVKTVAGYNLGLTYEPCYGAGTLLDETIAVGPDTYRVCELAGTITANFKFDDDINDDMIAWALKGQVQIGESFAGLDTQRQLERLSNPQKAIMSGQSLIVGRAGSSLAINPGVALRARGSARSAITLSSIDSGTDGAGEWGGLTINGIADSCPSAEACQLAEQPLVDISFLRILEAGAGGPALTLNQLSPSARLSHLDVTGSAAGGVLLNGGAANLDHLVTAQLAGDHVAWRNGYRGTLQYAVLTADNDSQGHALRGQNSAENHDASPRSRPVLANITAVGADNSASGILLEQGSGLLLYNSVFTGFSTCLDIDDAATAALQTADPKGIHFGGVVLDCGATLVAEDEGGGFDYGYATQISGEVYEVPAVLDTQFVAAGDEIPAAGAIDPSLLGDAAAYLNLAADWMGAVRDSVDTWYAGWSDSVYVELAAECDFKGTLEDPVDFPFEYTQFMHGSGLLVDGVEVATAKRYHKVCSLRGTLSDDFHLTAYTGTDREAIETGGKVSGAFIITGANPDQYTDQEVFAPLPTVWLLNGMVHVGEGHRELTDLAQVQAMKENPVTLTIDPATIILATEGAGLHVTRGGALRVLGGPHYRALNVGGGEPDRNTTGPVNMMGLTEAVVLYSRNSLTTSAPVEPLKANSDNWVGIIVDGFARNNQCPDAATAEPGSQICNIPGEYGYHGGYDDDHDNVFIEHLSINQGNQVQFNSVGRGTVNHLKWFRFDPTKPSLHQGFSFNGGALNMKQIYLTHATPYGSPFLRWNNGFRGNLQHVYISGAFPSLTETEALASEGWSYPIISGSNGDPGSEEALPRSKPTIANLSLRIARLSLIFPGASKPSDGAAIGLTQGSGLYLYNSVLGHQPSSSFVSVSDPAAYCFAADSTSAPLVGTDIVVDNLAWSCAALADEDAFAAALRGDSKSSVEARFDYAFSSTPWGDHDYDFGEIEDLKLLTDWDLKYFPAQDIVGLGPQPLDVSSSTTVDADVITETDYLGSEDYFLFQEYGGAVAE